MNKKIIISLIILTAVTAVAGYFLYQWYTKNNPPSKFGQMGGGLFKLPNLLKQATPKQKFDALEIIVSIDGLSKQQQDAQMNKIVDPIVRNIVNNYIITYPRGTLPVLKTNIKNFDKAKEISSTAKRISNQPKQEQIDDLLTLLPVQDRVAVYKEFKILQKK
jgi:hypothetical protein